MEQIGFCGMVCNECPVFLAIQKNDDEERKKLPKYDLSSKIQTSKLRLLVAMDV